MTCSVDGCERVVDALGLCGMHYQRVKKTGDAGPAHPLSRAGAGNGNWRGGRIRTGEKMRYWARHVPAHPNANKLGYVLEHRLVMEEELGRFLDPSEVVHHVNHDPSDNRPENLEVLPHQSEHAREHAIERHRASGGRGWGQRGAA